MFRVCIFAIFICVAQAGLIGLGGLDDGHGLLGSAPVALAAPSYAVAHAPSYAVAHAPSYAVAHAPVAVAHGASSWQNNNLLALNPTAVVTKVAAPVAVAAPVYAKVAAPVAVGVAPWGGVSPWGLGVGKGLAIGGYGLH